MRLSFNPLTRNAARLACCLAIALTTSTGSATRGAIVFSSTPDEQATLVRCLSSGLIVDFNQNWDTLPIAGLEDQSRESLPSLAPEYDQTSEPALADDQSVSKPSSASPVAADTDASDDGDYMEYQYGRYYGRKYDANPATPQSTENSARADDSSAADDGNDSAEDDSVNSGDTVQDDDVSASGENGDVEQAEMPRDGNGVASVPAEETAGDDDCSGDPAMVRAMGAVVANWTNEFLTHYGLTTAQVTRLLDWIR
jgi:hypothetical protein